jgi:hypothetical protein
MLATHAPPSPGPLPIVDNLPDLITGTTQSWFPHGVPNFGEWQILLIRAPRFADLPTISTAFDKCEAARIAHGRVLRVVSRAPSWQPRDQRIRNAATRRTHEAHVTVPNERWVLT